MTLRNRRYLGESTESLGTRLKFKVKGKGKNAKYYFTFKHRGYPYEYRIMRRANVWIGDVREPEATFKSDRQWNMLLDIGLGKDSPQEIAKVIEKNIKR